jgi:hypothetical protein
MQNQKGKIIELTEPQEFTAKNGKDYKKAQIVIGWTEQGKDKSFIKRLAMDILSTPDNFSQRWNKVIQNYSVGDDVEVSFDVVSNEGSNGGWFTSAKYINMKHQDKEVNRWQQTESPSMPDEESDLPF